MTTIDNIMALHNAASHAAVQYALLAQVSLRSERSMQALEDRNEANEALRAALAQQAEQGWQPISTAPRETEIFIGNFIDGKFKFGRSEMFYEQANEFAGETFSGWVWSEDECSSSITDSPTHWMPLPAAPKGGV